MAHPHESAPLVERATFKTTSYSAKSWYSAGPGIPQNLGIPQNQVIPQNRGILQEPVFRKIKLFRYYVYAFSVFRMHSPKSS